MTKQQVALLPIVKAFGKDFRLVGGTAIALHIGHRRSIDYSEKVIYKNGFLTDDEIIKKALVEFSLEK
ncbi:hypothetical protein L6250_03710 [Candidatus Parcubacteria bacterium]|nr:hypothetical protein [Candidatus Parcubacteria bacterium]